MIEGPAKLLPRSKRYGQAPILDRWMLEAVVSYLAAQPGPCGVFHQLSGKTVADESFLGTVCHLLDHYGVADERLGFEVTETAAVVNLADAQRLITACANAAASFALDDFGRRCLSFFSSNTFGRLPQDRRRLVRGMLDDRREGHRTFDRAVARDFGMHSVAEQVEDAAMAALLNDIGVDYLQGYHIHRPEALPHWQPVSHAGTVRPPQLTLVR